MTDAELELARSQAKELRAGPTLTAFGMAVARSLESLIEERDRLHDAYKDEHRIVARIWEMFGSPTMDELKGRNLFDLIDEVKAERDALAAKCGELEEELKQAIDLKEHWRKQITGQWESHPESDSPSKELIDAAAKAMCLCSSRSMCSLARFALIGIRVNGILKRAEDAESKCEVQAKRIAELEAILKTSRQIFRTLTEPGAINASSITSVYAACMAARSTIDSLLANTKGA